MNIEDITIQDLNKYDPDGTVFLGLQTYLKKYKKVEPLKLNDNAYIGTELIVFQKEPVWIARFFVWTALKHKTSQIESIFDFLHGLGLLTALEGLVQVGILQQTIMRDGQQIPSRSKKNPHIDKTVAWIKLFNDTWNNWTPEDTKMVAKEVAKRKELIRTKKKP